MSSDGFMLNILHVLQELSSPIKKEKVGLFTLFEPEWSPIRITADEAKINCSKEAFVDFIDKLGNLDFKFSRVNEIFLI